MDYYGPRVPGKIKTKSSIYFFIGLSAGPGLHPMFGIFALASFLGF